MRIILPFKLLLLSIVFITSTASLNSQVNNNSSLTEKDPNYSEHLINGPVYYQSNPFSKGSPFLFENFISANIYTCSQDFENVDINYDILDQKLVILFLGKNNTKTPIETNPILIDSFNVAGFNFIANNGKYDGINSPFFIKINNLTVDILFTYRKDFIRSYSQENPYGFISDTKKRVFILRTSNTTDEIRSFKFLKEYYPDKWKLIKRYIRKNSLIFRSVSVSQMTNLLIYCDSI